MLQSSPSHVRVPRLARTRAKVALILTSVCALVAAVLIPLTSHLNAQAATQVPGTIPSLEGWTPASGTWTPAGGLQIVHTDSAEAAGVSALLSRALADSGITGITDGTGAAPSTNAVSLTIDPSQSTLGDEGYQLTVTGNGAQVVAATRAGLLWGARTLEQAVRSGKGTVPTGSITDIPRFPDRGVTLCACGTHITPDWINRQIDRMSDLKMNYLSLELRIKSDKYPATTSFSYYTKDEVKAIVEHGREVGVRVVPLLNAPGHTGTISVTSRSSRSPTTPARRAPTTSTSSTPPPSSSTSTSSTNTWTRSAPPNGTWVPTSSSSSRAPESSPIFSVRSVPPTVTSR